jgi:hypothetical protein
MVERIKSDMASGKSYSESMGAIMGDIRNKDGYSEYMNNKAGIGKPPMVMEGKD